MMEERDRLERRLLRATAQAVRDFNLIEDGDHLMVAVSGGRTATRCSTSSCVCVSARPCGSS